MQWNHYAETGHKVEENLKFYVRWFEWKQLTVAYIFFFNRNLTEPIYLTFSIALD